MTEELQKTSEPNRLLVHCRAGMGRTGTTVSLVNAILRLEMSEGTDKAAAPVSIADIVAKERTQRAWFCNESNQYEFIHKVLAKMYLK